MDKSLGNVGIEDIIETVESRVRGNLTVLQSWTDEVRDLLENRPGAIVGSLAVAGFLTGVLVRRGPIRMSSQFSTNPLLAFGAAAIAGYVLGPELLNHIESVNETINGGGGGGGRQKRGVSNADSAPLNPSQRDFSKSAEKASGQASNAPHSKAIPEPSSQQRDSSDPITDLQEVS